MICAETIPFFTNRWKKNTISENGFQLCDRWKRLCQPATAPAGQERELVGYTVSALSYKRSISDEKPFGKRIKVELPVF